jgi:hypothetical protein
MDRDPMMNRGLADGSSGAVLCSRAYGRHRGKHIVAYQCLWTCSNTSVDTLTPSVASMRVSCACASSLAVLLSGNWNLLICTKLCSPKSYSSMASMKMQLPQIFWGFKFCYMVSVRNRAHTIHPNTSRCNPQRPITSE